jgi:type IV secretion system pilin
MTLADLVSQVVTVINWLVAILGSVALLIFLWGGVRYLYKADDVGKEAQKEFLGWSLVAFFVLVSIFGILEIVQRVFLI